MKTVPESTFLYFLSGQSADLINLVSTQVQQSVFKNLSLCLGYERCNETGGPDSPFIKSRWLSGTYCCCCAQVFPWYLLFWRHYQYHYAGYGHRGFHIHPYILRNRHPLNSKDVFQSPSVGVTESSMKLLKIS